jgi:hypothetical protein
MLLAWEATQIKKWKSPQFIGQTKASRAVFALYSGSIWLFWYSEKIYTSEKFFWTPKMVHCPKFFWRRGGGGGGGSPKKIFLGSSRAQSEKVGQISFCPPNFFLPVRPCRYWQAKLCAHEYSDVLLRFLSVMHHDTSGENFLWKRAWTKKVCIQSYFEVSNMMKPRDSM